MIFAPFDWPDFLAPLDGWVLALAVVLGLALGWTMGHLGTRPARGHFFYLVTAGAVFFVPLAVLRAAQLSPVWERFLATFLVWIVFAAGMEVGIRWRR